MSWRQLPELRCVCGRLLLKGMPLLSQLQVKCHRCHLLVHVGQEYDTFTAQQYAFLVEVDGERSEKLRTRIVDCTSSVEKALGYTRDELLALNDAIDPILAHGGYDDAWALYSKTQLLPFSVETIHRRKDGSLIKVRARGNFQRQGKAIFLLSTFDILETEDVTYDPEFRIACSELPNYICQYMLELSPKGECSYVSSKCMKVFGGAPRDLARSLIFSFIAPDERDAVRKRYLDCAQARQSFRMSALTLIAGDGSHFVVEAHCTARYGADGVFEGYIVSLWPVDEPA